MKKITAFCLTATLVASLLTGCGEAASTPASESAAPSSVAAPAASESAAVQVSGKSLTDILAAVEAVNPIANPRDLDDFALENDYRLTMDNIQDFVGKVSNDQGDAGTILVLKAAPGKGADLEKELVTYQKDQTNYWGNYAEFADAQASAKEGRIVVNGDYAVLVFASLNDGDYAAIDKAVEEALG